jgi:hypothetical protein
VTAAPISGSGFSGNVALAAQGLPAGVIASFSPATICLPVAACGATSTTSTMTVTSPVSLTAAAVMGTSGTLSHMAAAQGALTVQDFTLTVTPSSSSASPLVVTAGQALNFTVTAAGVNGFTSPVNLSLILPGSALFEVPVTPGGAPASFTWVVPANTAGGPFNYSISAQLGGLGGLTHSVTGQLSVAAQNFSQRFDAGFHGGRGVDLHRQYLHAWRRAGGRFQLSGDCRDSECGVERDFAAGEFGERLGWRVGAGKRQ